MKFINDFEHFVARYSCEQGCTDVVCGCIHVRAIRRIEEVDYHNCGDWVEHCSALVECDDGTLELTGPDRLPAPAPSRPRVAS